LGHRGRGQGSRVGDRAPGSGWGTEVGVRVRTGAPRSGCRRPAWLVAGVGCRACTALTFGRHLGRRQWHGRWAVAVFGGGGGGFEEEQRSSWCWHRGQEGVEVRASGRAGGQPGEEHGRAGGGDGRPTMRSSWGGAQARGGMR
jgi:hypothetical protein